MLQASALGEVARQVNGVNELWLATALSHAALQVLFVFSGMSEPPGMQSNYSL